MVVSQSWKRGDVNISIISGSRADHGLLAWPTKLLREDPFFSVAEVKIWNHNAAQALQAVSDYLADAKPDYILILGDRFEIMAAVMAAHLQRIPIAHIGGGDVSEGSYDNAMRDCISRLASIHLATSDDSVHRLRSMGYTNIHLVGNPGIDYIHNADWKRERPISSPYVVISYQAETINGVDEIESVLSNLPANKMHVFIMPNPDRGSDKIKARIQLYVNSMNAEGYARAIAYDVVPHDAFLNLLAHCDEFIGNSSSIFYEVPALGVKTRLIGKRQRGRVEAWGDGHASERIVKILKRA